MKTLFKILLLIGSVCTVTLPGHCQQKAFLEEKACLFDTTTRHVLYAQLDLWNIEKTQWDWVMDAKYNIIIDVMKREIVWEDYGSLKRTFFDIKDCEWQGGPVTYTCKRRHDNVLFDLTFDSNEIYRYMIIYNYKDKIKTRMKSYKH